MKNQSFLYIIIVVLLLSFGLGFSQSKLSYKDLAFEKGVTVFYLGSGASTRHFDSYKFQDETFKYQRTPFLAFGVDHFLTSIDGGNAYLGIGPYFSTWAANRYYTDARGNSKESLSTNSLIGVKLTHHNTFVIWKSIDMCVSLISGARIKYYHQKSINNTDIVRNVERLNIEPAIGLTATIRYYFYKNMGIYFEAGAGYKTDLAAFGIIYKIKK